MAVILRTLNVLNPAIRYSSKAKCFIVDRPVLIGRTALTALLTFGISFMVSRRLDAGRYAALASAAASIGLGLAAYFRESSRAANAAKQWACDLYLKGDRDIPQDLIDSMDLESFQLSCQRANPHEIKLEPIWLLILKFDDLSGHALNLYDKVHDKERYFLDSAIYNKRPGVVASLLKKYSNQIEPSKAADYLSRARDAKTAQILLERFKDLAPNLLGLIIQRDNQHYDSEFTKCDHYRAIPGLWKQGTDEVIALCNSEDTQLAAAIKADRFLYTGNKAYTDIEEMDRETFDAICRRCQDIDLRSDALDKTIHTNLWKLVCKFDYHSTEENSLFSKLMKLIDESPHAYIVQEFPYAVKQNCPNVVKFLLNSKRIKSTDYYMPSDRFSCWSGLQNAHTAELLQEYEFDVNEHPELLDCVIFEKAFYPRPSGFTQIDHVRAILKARVKREFVEAVVKKLPADKGELLSTLNKYLDQN